jgi:hypothetical protein
MFQSYYILEIGYVNKAFCHKIHGTLNKDAGLNKYSPESDNGIG